MSRSLVFALALACASCAETGVLELQLTLPPQPATEAPLFASVQVRSTADPFSNPWGGATVESIELGTGPQTDCISVVSRNAEVDVNVRVSFCHDPNCVALGDDAAPERFYRLEHPFYIGRRTFFTTTIASVPTCTMDSDCGGIGICIGGQCECVTDSNCCSGAGCTFACENGIGLARRCVDQVDHCHIEGCVLGEPARGDFCDVDGTHFCETYDEDRSAEAYLCGP
jgi:hypothetical protein